VSVFFYCITLSKRNLHYRSTCLHLVTKLLYRSFFTLVFLSSFLYRITTPSLYSSFQQHNQCIPHLTACQEFAHLYRTPTLFSLISSRSRSLRSRNPFLFAFFLICGDVKPNPGPTLHWAAGPACCDIKLAANRLALSECTPCFIKTTPYFIAHNFSKC